MVRSALVILLVVVAWGCANIRAPQGGAKDVDPPQVVLAEPAMGTVNFAGSSFSLTFNEYVQLSDIRGQLVVSPPLSQAPQVSIRKKTVTVSWEEPLRDSTTYTFFFGDGIRDFTEANPAENLSYVLATGPELDSLSFSGVVRDAASGEPVTGYRILAYRTGRDKPALSELPDYFARSETGGLFTLRNLAAGSYDLVALDDVNGNYLVDPFESVAFSAHPVVVGADSTPNAPDLRAFAQPSFEQLIRDYATDSSGYARLLPGRASTQWSFQDLNQPDREILWQTFPGNDSLHLWMMGAPANAEVPVEIQDDQQVIDTLDLRFYTRDPRPLTLEWEQRKITDADKPIRAVGSEFITSLEPTGFLCQIDSVKQGMIIERDPNDPRAVKMYPGLQPGQSCTIEVYPGAIHNAEGWTLADTLRSVFTARKLEDYTELTLHLQGFTYDGAVLFELLDDKGKRIRTWTSAESGQLRANRLTPGTYRVRWIEDKNANGKWDPGDYSTGLQPERVQYFPETIQARANWVMDVDWIHQP